jgi:Ca2+-binding EF-hand superfamily protein
MDQPDDLNNENEEIRELFNTLDVSSRGVLMYFQLLPIWETFLSQKDVSQQDFEKLVHKIDKNGDGLIQYDDFYELGIHLLQLGFQPRLLKENFNSIMHTPPPNINRSGLTTMSSRKRSTRKVLESDNLPNVTNYSEKDKEVLRGIFEFIDTDGNGTVEVEELGRALRQVFTNILKHT